MALTKVSGDFLDAGSITQAHLHTSHGITTTHIAEGDKLFFTNARVDSRVGSLSTSDLSEGTNLYYTDARADARIAAADTGDLSEGTNLYYTQARFNTAFTAKSTSDLSEGTNLYYTDARADARITAADTDSLSEGSTNLYYTDARADARVALIVDSAPGTLNTLNELAAALGDDANFSTTVTNSIATKMPLAGGTFTGNVTLNSSSYLELYHYLYTRSHLRVLNAAGNGWHNWATRGGGKYDLDVNNITAADTKLNLVNYNGGTGITSQGELMIKSAGKTGWVSGDELGKISFYQTDGSGEGPGYQASIRATNETGNGTTTTISSCGLHFYTSNYNALERYAGKIDHDRIWDSKGGFAVDGTRKDLNWDTAYTYSQVGHLPLAGGTITSGTNIGLTINHDTFEQGLVLHRNHATNAASIVFKNNTGMLGTLLAISSDNQPYWQEGTGTDSFKIWTANNDGSGSGLDADLLDGINSTGFVKQLADLTSGAPDYQTPSSRRVDPNAGNPTNAHYAISTFGNGGNVTGQLAVHLSNGSGYIRSYNSSWSSWRKLWHDNNDGSGSGLDADLLDGQHASAFLTSLPSHNHDDRYYTETETNNLLADKTNLNDVRSLGTTAFTGTATTAGFISEIEGDGAFDSYTSFFKHSWSYSGNDNLADAGRFTETAGASFITWTDNSSDSTRGNITVLAIAPNTGGSAGKMFVYNDQGSSYSPGWREIWCNTSDGSGSGLDADLLDGQHASAFQPAGSYVTLSGSQSITGTKTFSNSSLVISGSHASISFLDTTSNADDFYIHVNSNNFYVLTDRDGGNQVDAGYESPHPLHLEADTNTAYTFGNRILTTADEGSGNGIDADTVDGVQGGSFLRSDADDSFTGKLVVDNTGVRRAGMYGIYDSMKIGHIWSMGSAYMIPQSGANFGNLYGLAYYHPNNATNGAMASGHQMVWCQNGTAKSAIGTNIWTDGIIDADGATFGGTVSMNGQTISMGNGNISGINHLVINDPGVNEGLQWTGGNNWYIQECPDGMTNASGNLQFSTGTTRRFTINTSGYVYAERYYDMGSTGYYLDPGGDSNLNSATFAGDLQINGNQVRTLGGNADVKFSVWSGSTYGIGMTSGVTLGHLNDYAMTFCMNNEADRGFWWGYSGQNKAAGAMALTTGGMLTVTDRVVAPNYYVDGYIYHNGDTNTYIRMIAADDMQLVAGGRQMLRMDEGGDPDKLRFVTDNDWTNSNGNWAMSGYITVQGAVYSNDGLVYDKDDSSAYYRATGTSTPHGDIFFQSTNRIWWNSQTTSSNYFAIQGGVSSGAYIDFNATGSTKKIHWRQFGTHTRFTMDMSSAAFVAMGPVSANGSDLRLKENVVTIDGALAKVKAMRGVYYNRIDLDTERRRVGVIAQEIETVLPEVVDQVGQLAQHPECDDDEIRAVSYGNISAVLIEAIKEQQTIIDDLKTRLETLENQ